MPVLIDWLVEGEVIYHHWWGTGTLDDARYANQQMLELYMEYPNSDSIHIIVNGVYQEKTEVSIPSARRIYTVLYNKRTGWIMCAISNSLIVFILNILLQFRNQNQFRIRQNLDDCIDVLKDANVTINWDNADWSIIERFEAEMNAEIQDDLSEE